jgi:4-amino-4-deoxy-L-arabinose transferase-like glycosyltransferase
LEGARARLALSFLLFASAFSLLLWTAGDYGLTWDEPAYIESADRLSDWFGTLGPGSFTAPRIREAWVFARRDNRNLPVPVLISLLGRTVGRAFSPPVSYRLGVCLVMALTVAVLFSTLARAVGVPAGLAGALALLLNPPLFAHGHIAATDTPVSCFFLLSIALWLEGGGASFAWLVACCGLGLASKASFALFPLLLLVWLGVFGRSSDWKRALLLFLLAPLVALGLCPMWWAHPFSDPLAFLTRVARAGEKWQIDAFYLGKASTETLPWHSGFVLTAVTTPPLVLVLAGLGALSGVLRRDRGTVLWTLGALALPLARLLPNAPGHDGARLLIPSLYCLSPLAGLGFARACRALGRLRPFALPVVFLALVSSVATMHPYEMSYYSEAVGGLKGAERLGFEVSYWFDALTPRALKEIQALLPEGALVETAPRYTGYPLLRKWGLWRPDLKAEDEQAQYLVLYSRRGYFSQIQRLARIEKEEVPLWSLKCSDVPLVRLYRLSGEPGGAGSAR